MASLFRDVDFRYTVRAGELEKEACNALGPILSKVLGEGYSPRDAQYILEGAVQMLCLEALLTIRCAGEDKEG